ncbi:phage tail protein I [Pseudovibrio sp. Tun.PSC04-5.I4]|uniref:phage tail protein I n=1 Tax=Pseudovibrio sp. Tun.PSC04-5.I4 TaxID=1798213 RepID=UPI00088B3BB4|nr:phage tail protein I [Pseudovibrio sp. Tun.PSC04-5.I4]SDQ17110.1 phage tail protein, P2 protein I family [Pseudovibrio sp. Tun.PSC04-5.I4]
MADRRFPYTLIPPSINEPRTRALLDAFEAMAAEFDFATLMQRYAEETSTAALPLAVHDRSLDEFIGEDGLPDTLVRKLIDQAWDLHEKKGRDEGVKLAQSLLGIAADIEHWWQQEPEGPHDTYQITLRLGDLDDPPDEPLSLEVQKTALKAIAATKRYSQDTSTRWLSVVRAPVRFRGFVSDLHKNRIFPPIITELNNTMALGFGAAASTGEVMRIRPWRPEAIQSQGLAGAVAHLRPRYVSTTIYPRPA